MRLTLRCGCLLVALGSGWPRPTAPAPAGEVEVRVLTYNLYVGADLTRVARARSLSGLAREVEAIVAQVEATDFVARADGLAEIVAREAPDLVSLQEVALWRRDRDGGGLLSCGGAGQVTWDFLAIVRNALARHGQHYRVAVVAENEDVSAPTTSRGTARLVDRNALLVREGIEVLETDAGHFDEQRSRTFLGLGLTSRKGWVSALLRKQERTFRAIGVHLELPHAVQASQVAEVLALDDGRLPTVWAGDFNTNAGLSAELARQLRARRLADAWTETGSGPGSTCCQEKSLRQAGSRLRWRPDLILLSPGLVPVSIRRVGATPDSRATRGKERLWISDHAGVAAVLRLPAAGRPGEI
jgi:endonuclease/exonuclease/phosphatase family metal-dependent hydrolase